MKARLCLFAAMLCAAAGALGAEDQYRLGGNILAAGETVALEAAGMKSVFAAGESVLLRAPASGDAHLVGDRVETDKIGGDAYLAGRSVFVNDVVGGQLWAIGNEVSLSALVGDDAVIAADRAIIDGAVGGDMWLAAPQIEFGGEVGGDLSVFGEELIMQTGARIGGDLLVTSPTRPEIPDGVVGGEIRYEEWHEEFEERGGGGALLIFFSALIAGALLFGFGGDFPMRAARIAGEKPWPTLARGFAVFAAMLIAPPVLFFTVVAAPLGVIALLLIVPLFFFGYVLGAWIFGGALWRKWKGAHPDTFSRRLLSLAFALVAASLLLWIPVVGFAAVLTLLFFGLGGGLRALAAKA